MKEQTEKFKTTLQLLAVALTVCVVSFAAFGFFYFSEFEKPGQWGDFFGGTLNPILSSLTLLALLSTIYLQRQSNDLQRIELKQNREELKRSASALENQLDALKKQNFEATFFKMLEMQNDLLNNIDIAKRNGTTLHGRDCFRYFYDKLRRSFGDALEIPHDVTHRQAIVARLNRAEVVFWPEILGELGHYYRHLNSLIKFVHTYEGDRALYMEIIRAQLSNHELALLLYNCLSEHGSKMKDLVEKYALLKHLPDDLLLNPSHKSLISPTAFGEEHQPGSK